MIAEATAYGLIFRYPAGDSVIGPALRDAGEFARPEVDLICAYLAEGGDLLDIGANIGSICLPVAKALPQCRVTAVEAAPLLAETLESNAAVNGLDRVTVVHAVAAAAPGEIEFPHPGTGAAENLGGLRVGSSFARQIAVRAVTVDDLATPSTRFIKIDVEGYEIEVLRGAGETLRIVKPIILAEANADRGDAAQIAGILLAAGYRCFWFFAPHITKAVAAAGASPFRGDTNIVALPPGVENFWSLAELPEASAQRPGGLAAYPYLRRYGY